ncbi:hypothetical protein K7432_008141 [Basidiobolus ranarum]|uniref:Uncharacterized protein n=1 Tax=Basidiobolus ranarum TaxID=34480 RepID=A0ABR2VZ98_9FUNG
MFTRFQKNITSFDAFPKVDEGYQRRSKSGGFLSFVITLVLLYLLQSEIREYWAVKQDFEFLVDQGIQHTMQVNLDIYVPMECENLTVDVLDAAGATSHVKRMLNVSPAYLAFSSLGKRTSYEESDEIDVHQIIRESHQEKRQGIKNEQEYNACRVTGSMEVNKVAGNLHITALGHGYGGAHVDHEALNFTHYIRHLSFGHNYPHLINPLNDVYEVTESNFYVYQYFISIVPTIYIDNSDNILLTNQYAVTDSSKDLRTPGEQNQVPGKVHHSSPTSISRSNPNLSFPFLSFFFLSFHFPSFHSIRDLF